MNKLISKKFKNQLKFFTKELPKLMKEKKNKHQATNLKIEIL